ncbi:hypothetical protein OG618_02210 [Kitasatospora sp. NBC_01246]|uniref:hypothetical protein n=1 Tax=Kitasatospora sp. NBC_01246 TaxID=2903570 RepID=UPI002E32C90F|nr:hypothetical protein [Kitasatospora sp. NBC_01246]
MSARSVRHRAGATAVLAAAAALLLTGCGPGAAAPGKAAATADPAGRAAATAGPPGRAAATAGDGQVQEMQQKVDAAESAVAQADSDATQDN